MGKRFSDRRRIAWIEDHQAVVEPCWSVVWSNADCTVEYEATGETWREAVDNAIMGVPAFPLPQKTKEAN